MSNAVDLDQLERDVRATVRREHPEAMPREVAQYANRPSERMPLEIIAQAITRLTWTEAEAMGAAIHAKLGTGEDVAPHITKAIQAWASTYLPKQM